MASEASEYLLSQKWCKRIRKWNLDVGWEGVLGVFSFEFDPIGSDVDSKVWIIVGDIPPAYVCNDNSNGASALDGYVKEMQAWVDAVKAQGPIDHLIPVNVPPTMEYAELLERRLDFIRRNLLKELAAEIDKRPIVRHRIRRKKPKR